MRLGNMPPRIMGNKKGYQGLALPPPGNLQVILKGE